LRTFPLPSLLALILMGCASGSPGGGSPGGHNPPGAPVLPGGPEAQALAVDPLPVWEPEYGQEVQATVGTFPPIAGRIQAVNEGVLILRDGARTYPLRLSSIRRLEVRRYRRTRAVEGGVVGALFGAVLGRVTLVGIGGEHWENQGRLLAPGLGAIMGGLLGALAGGRFGGDYWEEVRIPASVSLSPRRIVEGSGRPLR
jgi:hypothetical protein